MNFSTTYNDKFGTESVTIISDGEMMKVEIRGIQFEGHNFDCFELSNKDDFSKFVNLFSYKQNRNEGIDYYYLHNCEFHVKIPIVIAENREEKSGDLEFSIKLHDTTESNVIQSEYSIENISLLIENNMVSLASAIEFESILNRLNKELPEKQHIKSCISCKFSGYWPGGNDFYADLMCYKNISTEYVKIRNKSKLFELHKRFNESVERVQETHLCEEFKLIKHSDWSYKNWDID